MPVIIMTALLSSMKEERITEFRKLSEEKLLSNVQNKPVQCFSVSKGELLSSIGVN